MYIADGDYIKDIEVNDLRNRYTLTKGATQKMVNLVLSSGIRLDPLEQSLLLPLPQLLSYALCCNSCGIQLLVDLPF